MRATSIPREVARAASATYWHLGAAPVRLRPAREQPQPERVDEGAGWVERHDTVDGFQRTWRERTDARGVTERVYLEAPWRDVPSLAPIRVESGRATARTTRDTGRVVLSDQARSHIRAATWGATTEEGGYLHGKVEGDTVIVERAVTSGRDQRPASVSLGSLDGHGYLDDVTVVGDWHTHPGGGGRPSNADERGWRARRRA